MTEAKTMIKVTNQLDRDISAQTLLKFALPTIISMVFMGIYTTVDGIFVSRLVGTDALSAVNIMMPLVMAAVSIGTMLGSGGSAIVAKQMGEGLEQQARQNFSLIVLVALIASCALVLIGFVGLAPLIHFLGADQLLYPYCLEYAQPTLCFIPSFILAMVFQVFFIAAGKARLGLFFSLLGGICNIVLDYLFIAILGLGLSGAAIATGIGYSVPALSGIVYFFRQRQGSLYLVKPKFSARVIGKSCTNGASEMVTNLSLAITTLLLNNILIRLAGSDGVASITIILYIYGLLSSAYIGYFIGISPIISYNYGKQDHLRLQKIYYVSLRAIFLTAVATFLLALLGASPLVAIFAPVGTPVYELAVGGFRIFASCFLFMGFNGYGSAMFTALSNGKVSALISLMRALVFVVIAALILPTLLGIPGVWLVIPVAELAGLGVTGYYLHKLRGVYHYA